MWAGGTLCATSYINMHVQIYIIVCQCVRVYTLLRRGPTTFHRCYKRRVTQKRLQTTVRISDYCGTGTLPLKQMREMTISNQDITNVHQMWVLRA